MKKSDFLSPCFLNEVYMIAIKIKSVELDICPKTGGIWFDRFEIQKFDETHEDISDLLQALPKNPIPPEVLTSRRSPQHREAIMQQQPYGPKGMNNVLTVDICPVSAGIWLDYLEIQKIRELYPTVSEKKKSIEEFVKNSFKFEPKTERSAVLGLTRLLSKLSE